MKYQFLLIALFTLSLVGYIEVSNAVVVIENPSPDAGGWDSMGEAVGISEDGEKIFVGVGSDDLDQGDGSNYGAVYVYDKLGNPLATLNNPYYLTNGSSFFGGYSIASSGNKVFISDINADTNSTSNSGLIYVFELDTYTLVDRIFNPTPSSTDIFGERLDAHNDILLVSARNTNLVRVFNTTDNSLITTITGEAGEQFGRNALSMNDNYIIAQGTSGTGTLRVYDATTYQSVVNMTDPFFGGNGWASGAVITDNYLIIGQEGRDGVAPTFPYVRQGAIHIYDANTLQFIQTVHGTEEASNINFGEHLGASDDIIVVNDYATVDGFTTSGTLTFIDPSTGNVLFRTESANPNEDSNIGWDIRVAGTTVVAGEPFTDVTYTGDGRGYIFTLTTLADQASCEAVPFSGSWNNNVCSVTNVNLDGDRIIINQGINLIVDGTVSTEDTYFVNNGIITNYGALLGDATVVNNGKITNKCDGTSSVTITGSAPNVNRCGGASSGSTTSGVNSNIPQLSDIPQVTSTESLGVPQESDSVEDLFANLFSNRIGENIETPTQSFTSQPSSSSGSSSSVSSSPVANFFQNLFASWFS